jgi:hypothetical protein
LAQGPGSRSAPGSPVQYIWDMRLRLALPTFKEGTNHLFSAFAGG